MSEVRLRARKVRSRRAREIQGVLTMQGLDGEEPEATVPQRLDEQKPAVTMDAIRPLPYRTVLANWPDDWRERWGRLTNDLEDSGLTWRDAEGRAFLEIWNQLRITTQVERN